MRDHRKWLCVLALATTGVLVAACGSKSAVAPPAGAAPTQATAAPATAAPAPTTAPTTAAPAPTTAPPTTAAPAPAAKPVAGPNGVATVGNFCSLHAGMTRDQVATVMGNIPQSGPEFYHYKLTDVATAAPKWSAWSGTVMVTFDRATGIIKDANTGSVGGEASPLYKELCTA
jgi:hypothetical protein